MSHTMTKWVLKATAGTLIVLHKRHRCSNRFSTSVWLKLGTLRKGGCMYVPLEKGDHMTS